MSDFLIEHWGDLCSASGLIIAIGGFLITWFKIHETRRIAQETRQRIEQNLAMTELSEALTIAKEVKRLQREQAAWGIVLDRYTHLLSLLGAVKSAYGSLGPEIQKRLQTVINKIQKVELTAEKAMTSEEPVLDVPRWSEILSEAIVELGEIDSKIRTRELR